MSLATLMVPKPRPASGVSTRIVLYGSCGKTKLKWPRISQLKEG